MDDCLTERLVYSDSNSEDSENGQRESHSKKNLDDPVDSKLVPADEHRIADLSSSEDDQLNASFLLKKTKKSNKILSSDEEEEEEEEGEKAEISENDNFIHKQSNDEDAEDNAKTMVHSTARPTIWDSDTDSSSNKDSTTQIKSNSKKKTKKFSRKISKTKSQKKTDGSSSDHSGDDADGKVNRKKTLSKVKSICDNDSTASSSNDVSDDNENKNNVENGIKPRDKSKQRLSAKAAEEQIKEIQSESQRMARDRYINVPYHKPKQYSLKEFLNRRTIARQQHQECYTQPTQKAAAAIKMSKEELILYAERLEKRAQEAEEFFQNEDNDHVKCNESTILSENVNDEPSADASPTKLLEKNTENRIEINESQQQIPTDCLISDDVLMPTTNDLPNTDEDQLFHHTDNISIEKLNEPTNEPTNESQQNSSNEHSFPPKSDEQSNKTVEPNISETSNEHNQSNEPSKSDAESNKAIELHTTRMDLDDELDRLVNTDRKCHMLLSAEVEIDNFPKLHGGDGMIIDFETNELKPTQKSGIDELFERFTKNVFTKHNEMESVEIGIFNIDTGIVEKQKLHHFSDDPKTKKEPKPGEAYFKLKTELSKRITEKRREVIAKRIEEEKQRQKEISDNDNEDEEFDEFSDWGASDNEDKAKQANETINYDSDEEAIEIKKKDSEEIGENDEQEEINEKKENDNKSDEDSDADFSDENNETNSGGDSESDSNKPENDKPKRSRIVKAFEDDSGDEAQVDITSAQSSTLQSNVQKIDDMSISQSLETSATKINASEAFNLSICTDKSDSERPKNCDDLQALDSEIFQLNTSIETEQTVAGVPTLFDQMNNDGEEIGESQLMALCSGAFTSQLPGECVTNQTMDYDKMVEPDLINRAKESAPEDVAALLSSGDEDGDNANSKTTKFETKKKKKIKLDYSDDEDDEKQNITDEEGSEVAEEQEQEGILDNDLDDEEDPGEKFIEYDSDENEVEVTIKKNDMRNRATEFFENEAELSESEWGSADEDEKDLDKFEGELGDEDEFDKNKLRSELERIRLRQQIDQDAREIRILKERFFEEEDNGEERERKFRWKHLDNTGEIDPSLNADQEANEVHDSDDENEEEWRRLRYEREQLLKQQISESTTTVLETTTEIADQSISVSDKNATVALSSFRRTLLTKAVVMPKIASPFLINRTDLSASHINRKSFLNRDSTTLEKIMSLTKLSTDGETITNTAKGKGNYVFIATEKKNDLKRKPENATEEEPLEANTTKKIKLNETKKEEKKKQQTKSFFDLLS